MKAGGRPSQGARFSPTAMRTLDGELYLGWPPERVVDLNGWRCGLDRGATRRPNSIWPFAWQPHRPLAAGIQAAERLYREAGLRPCFRITPAAAPAGLAPALAARGYAREGASHVLVAEPCSLGTTPPRRGALAVSLDERPGPGWLACYEEGLASAAEGIALCGLLARIAAPHVFAAVTVEGRAASTALAVATRTCVQISAVRTLPACRRHGLAGSVLSALQDWARARGARQLALMVEATNAPALALYRKAGFHRAYDYHYLAPAAP